MYRAAVAGTPKVITANRLIDGLVVFIAEGPSWVTDIVKAAVFEDGAKLDEAMAFGAAEVAARKIVDPYTIDIIIEDGRPVPERLRERIRAIGPSVDYGEQERKRLTAARPGA
jgi:hypothetical protein